MEHFFEVAFVYQDHPAYSVRRRTIVRRVFFYKRNVEQVWICGTFQQIFRRPCKIRAAILKTIDVQGHEEGEHQTILE